MSRRARWSTEGSKGTDPASTIAAHSLGGDRVSADHRRTGANGDLASPCQDVGEQLERKLVDRPPGDVQGEPRRPTHRVHVAERVGGGDPAPVARIIDEGSEEVEGEHQSGPVREPIDRRVVTGLLRDQDVLRLGGRAEQVEHPREVTRTELARASGPVAERCEPKRLDHDQTRSVPIAWNPPSTCTSSPVIPDERSDRRNVTASPTGVGSSTSQPSGARRAHEPLIWSKPGIPFPAIVLMGPALTALTRIPFGPRSRARYRVTASSPAFATPIQS